MSVSNRALEVLDAPKPAVITCLTTPQHLEMISEIKKQGADLLEYRADLLPPLVDTELALLLRSLGRVLPVIFTVRTKVEGGNFSNEHQPYLRLLHSVMESVDAIDIELGNPYARSLVLTARAQRVASIVSHHNLRLTPPAYYLFQRTRSARALWPDHVKLATMTNHPNDVLQLDRVFDRYKKPPIVMGMGDLGVASRQHFIRRGVPAVYTFPEVPGMPSGLHGQQSTTEARQFIDDNYR